MHTLPTRNAGVVYALNAQLHEVARRHTPEPPLQIPPAAPPAASINLQGQPVGNVISVRA